MSILLTGATGYIGSHTAVELLNRGKDVIIVDNLSNSSITILDRIEKITGKRPTFYELDINDFSELSKVFDREDIDACIHFAGYKAVGESVEKPMMYYRNNIGTTDSLLNAMDEHGVKNIIFSSSATVYGAHNVSPLTEDMTTGTTNPYGCSKVMNEAILRTWASGKEGVSAICLRYFNPIGANKSGLIGEMPSGTPNNLMPYIQQVASGIRDHLNVFGDDYDTVDGTGVRDYIHVVDLALGHIAALEYAYKGVGFDVINLGTGHGTSVLELVNAFKRVNNIDVPYVIAERRAGDTATCFADASKAKRLLNWEAKHTVDEMCEDAWRWELNRKNYE